MAREFQDGRWVVHFWRDVGDNAHNQYELRQEIGRNVALNERLFLRLNLRIDHQSLSGAGVLSSEFPVRVEIGYIPTSTARNVLGGMAFTTRIPFRATGSRTVNRSRRVRGSPMNRLTCSICWL